MHTAEKGARGEDLACAHLQARGYRILGRNQRTPRGELDIVARSPDGILCFVEVKACFGPTAGDPASWITARKVLRIQRAAQAWAAVRGLLESPMRFDAMAVFLDEPPPRVEHLPDAFLPEARGYW